MNKLLTFAGSAVIAATLVVVPAVGASAGGIGAGPFGPPTSGSAAATTDVQESRPGGWARNGNGSHWVWGVIDGRTFSNSFHEGKCHGSTARGNGERRVTGIAPGKWSYANVPQARGGNTAYYHTC